MFTIYILVKGQWLELTKYDTIENCEHDVKALKGKPIRVIGPGGVWTHEKLNKVQE